MSLLFTSIAAGRRRPDPQAALVIADLTGLGVSLTTTQRRAISTWFKAGRAQGWYSLLKRMQVVVHGSAGPNAIDWISRGSGTYQGAPNFNTNGTAGVIDALARYDFGTNPSTQGLSDTSACFFVAAVELGVTNNRSWIHAQFGAHIIRIARATNNSSILFQMSSGNAMTCSLGSTINGVWVANVNSTNRRRVVCNKAGTITAFLNEALPTTINASSISIHGRLADLTANSDDRLSIVGFGLGMTDAQQDNFSEETRKLSNALSVIAI